MPDVGDLVEVILASVIIYFFGTSMGVRPQKVPQQELSWYLVEF